MNETTFDTGTLTLNVAVGPPSGPPMVLLHGVTRCWQDWLPLIPSLSVRWQVHALDFRGHGCSERVSEAYRVMDYVPDVLAYMEESFSEPAVVIGHSLGGMVAAAVAAMIPEGVRAVVLEDPPFEMMGSRLGETSYFGLFQAFLALAGSSQPVDEVAETLADAMIRRPGEDRMDRLGDVRDPVDLRFGAACLKQLDPDVLRPVVAGDWLDGFPTDEILRKIACPALFLQADYRAGGCPAGPLRRGPRPRDPPRHPAKAPRRRPPDPRHPDRADGPARSRLPRIAGLKTEHLIIPLALPTA